MVPILRTLCASGAARPQRYIPCLYDIYDRWPLAHPFQFWFYRYAPAQISMSGVRLKKIKKPFTFKIKRAISQKCRRLPFARTGMAVWEKVALSHRVPAAVPPTK